MCKIGKLAAVLLVAVALTAQAGIIMDDNFDGLAGSSLNSAYWVASGNTLNGDGTANISTATLEALSSLNVAPTAGEFVRATYYVSSANWNMGAAFPITTGDTGIVLRHDFDAWSWTVGIGGQGWYDTGFDKSWNWGGPTTYTIQFDWYTDKVTISVAENGGLIYDSSVDTPTWSIPTAARHPMIWGYGAFAMDRVVLETIPEPATMFLLGIGALLFGKRR
jgi:hypothetical protein